MNDYYRRFRHFLYRDFTPLTKLIIIVSFVLFPIQSFLSLPFVFHTVSLPSRPWTILTYPLANFDILTLVFSCLWLWFIGASLERSWGTLRYGGFLLLTSAGTAILMFIAGWALRVSGSLSGLWIPLVGVTWAWADLHPDQEILIWGVLPVKARWLAWIEAAITFFPFARYHWALGLAVLTGIPISYLFRGRGPFSPWRRWTPGQSSLKSWWNDRRREKRKNRFKVVK